MKIVYIGAYSTFGNIQLSGDHIREMKIDLTEEECFRFFALANEIVEARKTKMANEVSTYIPPSLPSPNCINADFKDVDDDIPF